MLTSLLDATSDNSITAEVAVIGAGLAGLVLAEALTAKGLSVVVLESGGERQLDEVHPLNVVEMAGQNYSGAKAGRFRCLGGTSSRWGAALLPYLDADLGSHPCGWHDGWGVHPAEIEPHLDALESRFAVARGSYEGSNTEKAMLSSFLPRLPKWPAFGNRSTAHIYRTEIANDPRLRVVTDATVTGIRLADGRVRGLVAMGVNGRQVHVDAQRVAIAAGAIETTRLLLLLNRAQGDTLFSPGSPLGLGFHDHISAPIATLSARNAKEVARVFGFVFRDGGMRNLRFELAPDTRVRLGLPGAFLHVAFARTGQGGFDGLRRIYQAVQRKSLPAIKDVWTIAKDLPWFIHAVWWRLAEKRVLPPSGSTFELHLVTEQKPDPVNRLRLSDTAKDIFGQPLLRIEWQIGKDDRMNFSRISNLALEEWNAGPLGTIAPAHALPEQDVGLHIIEGGGIFHPAGTTRIGVSAADSVVDTNLRVHGVLGLWAISTAAFPSVGGTSPSLGLLQFTTRAAQDIAASLHLHG